MAAGLAACRVFSGALGRSPLEGFDFVNSCEEVISTGSGGSLLKVPGLGGAAPFALCDDDRQLAVATFICPAMHEAARSHESWQRRPQLWTGATSEELAWVDTCSAVLAALNGHCYSAWHARKRLIARGAVGLHDELRTSTLVLRRFPKAPEAWAHRRWLIRHAASSGAAGSLPCWREEVVFCMELAAARRANYYAGVHMQWLLDQLGGSGAIGAWSGPWPQHGPDMLAASAAARRSNVSDPSIAHAHRLVLRRCVDGRKGRDAVRILAEELRAVERLMRHHAGEGQQGAVLKWQHAFVSRALVKTALAPTGGGTGSRVLSLVALAAKVMARHPLVVRIGNRLPRQAHS